MFTKDDIKKAEKLFSDEDWQPPEDCKALVTELQATYYKKTRERQNKFLMFYSLGLTIKDAAQGAGFDESLIYKWKKEEFSSFSSRCDLAATYARRHAIAQIHKHSQKDWRAAAWYLERKHKAEFAEVKKAEIEVNVNAKVTIDDKKSIADRFLGLIDDADTRTAETLEV